MLTKTAILAFVLTAALPPAAARVTEVRVTGTHTAAAGDTPDSARRLALADARRKALQAMVENLQQRVDIKALRLKPAHLEAFAAPIVHIEETGGGGTAPGRIDAVARIDAADAAGQINGFRKDQDISYELIAAGARAQHLQEQLATLTRRRAAATGRVAGGMLQEQLRLLDALDVNQVIARGYAALARTEPTTVGGRAIPAAGLERARRLADDAVMRWPESPDAHYLRGDVLVESEDPEGAEAEYRRALAAGASSAGRTKLATALRYQDKFDEAIVELEEAVRLAPSYARARADLGMVLGAQGKSSEAIAAYREAIRLDPDSTDAHNGLAVVLAKSGKMNEAVDQFREIIRVDPDSTIGYYNLAYALAELDRDVESAAALREVVRINPNHYNARFNLGELFRLEGKYDDSATQFREYLRLAPDTPQSQRNITRAKGYIRQFEDPDAPPVADTMMPRGPR
jgi:tetratricopeptide (TPR) repeat protein